MKDLDDKEILGDLPDQIRALGKDAAATPSEAGKHCDSRLKSEPKVYRRSYPGEWGAVTLTKWAKGKKWLKLHKYGVSIGLAAFLTSAICIGIYVYICQLDL